MVVTSGTGSPTAETLLAALDDLSGDPVVTSLEAFLDEVSKLAQQAIPNAASVGVTLAGRLRPRTAGASDDFARQVDEVQYEIGTGPCLHTLKTGEVVYEPHLADVDRWGRYSQEAGRRGARSSFSVPISTGQPPVVVGVLKLYATQDDAFDQAARARAIEFGYEVGGGVRVAHRLVDQARLLGDRAAAMDNRRVIDQALGVLMAQQRIGPDTAFTLLSQASQRGNVKVRDLAVTIVSTVAGTLPEPRAPFREDPS